MKCIDCVYGVVRFGDKLAYFYEREINHKYVPGIFEKVYLVCPFCKHKNDLPLELRKIVN